jgi:hypothetical protein
MGQARLWTANSTARDSFTFSQNSSTPPGQIVNWTIDRSVGSMRGLVFSTVAASLDNLSQFYVWVDGDGSGNQLIIQLYDSGKNYIAFTQKIDWTGWKPLIVTLHHPSYTGGESYFNYSSIISATYYYDNTNIATTNSMIVIGPPEVLNAGLNEGPFRFSRGLHSLSKPTNAVILRDQSFQMKSYPSVTFDQTSTNQFSVQVHNSTGPFPLIFGQSFNKNWKACVSNQGAIASSSICLPESDHFVANEYANGWIVNKTGSFSLTIYFSPDIVERVSVVASVIAWAMMAVVVLVPIRVRKRLTLFGFTTRGR